MISSERLRFLQSELCVTTGCSYSNVDSDSVLSVCQSVSLSVTTSLSPPTFMIDIVGCGSAQCNVSFFFEIRMFDIEKSFFENSKNSTSS